MKINYKIVREEAIKAFERLAYLLLAISLMAVAGFTWLVVRGKVDPKTMSSGELTTMGCAAIFIFVFGMYIFGRHLLNKEL